jgi:hypothetical protein
VGVGREAGRESDVEVVYDESKVTFLCFPQALSIDD